MNRCTVCEGKFKRSTKKHVIRTRHQEKGQITIENLPVLQCSVCGHVEIPEESEAVIAAIRASVRRDMERRVANVSVKVPAAADWEESGVSEEDPRDYVKETKEYFVQFKEKVRNLIG